MLLPIAALIGAAAGSPALRSRLVPLIVAGNALWVAASIAVLVLGLVSPNAIGVALVLGQAAVAVLTVLEAAFMRSAPAMALR